MAIMHFIPGYMLYLVLILTSGITNGQTDPPAVRVTVYPAETVRPDSPVEIHYDFPATDPGADRLWLPPVWQETQGLQFLGWEQRSAAIPGSRAVTWIARVRVLDSGLLTVPPLAFRGYAEGNLPAGAVSLAGESVLTATAPAITIHARSPWKSVLPAGLLALIGLPGAGVAGYLVHRRLTEARRGKEKGPSSIQDRWHRARRLRLDGDDYGALKELLALCGEAGCPRELIDELDAAARDAGFRNRVPDPDTFESFFRRVEKVITERTAGADHAPQTTGTSNEYRKRR